MRGKLGRNMFIIMADMPDRRMSVEMCGGLARSKNRTGVELAISRKYGWAWGMSSSAIKACQKLADLQFAKLY